MDITGNSHTIFQNLFFKTSPRFHRWSKESCNLHSASRFVLGIAPKIIVEASPRLVTSDIGKCKNTDPEFVLHEKSQTHDRNKDIHNVLNERDPEESTDALDLWKESQHLTNHPKTALHDSTAPSRAVSLFDESRRRDLIQSSYNGDWHDATCSSKSWTTHTIGHK